MGNLRFRFLLLSDVRYAVGQRYAVRFEYPEGRSPTTSYGWVLNGSEQYGQWLLLLLLFFAVMTQYAIALELRLAYCGLQNANLDLQARIVTGYIHKY